MKIGSLQRGTDQREKEIDGRSDYRIWQDKTKERKGMPKYASMIRINHCKH